MKTHGAKCTCPTCGHQHERMRKATDDEQQERASRRGLRGLREAERALREDAEHERDELRRERRRVEKAYTTKERAEVRRDKTERYGKGEVFAVPSLRSYPLTKDGKPSEERTMAAWRFVNEEANAEDLGGEAAAAKRRIKAFAKRHFGKDLQEGGEDKTAKALPADEVYALQDRALWPLTKALQPDPTLIRGAWQAVHSIAAQPLLSDEEAAVAEARIAYFAAHHKIAV